MAKVTTVTQAIAYTLELDQAEAEYLMALLWSGVCGKGIDNDRPLGRISQALRLAGVPVDAKRACVKPSPAEQCGWTKVD